MGESHNKIAKKHLADILKLKKTSVAIDKLKQLLAEKPKFIIGWIELGLLYRKKGDRTSAIATFEKTIKLAPNNPRLKLELATEQLFFKRIEDSRQNIEAILNKNPQHIQALVILGQLCAQENKPDEAIKLLQKAHQIDPEKIFPSISLAAELQSQKKYEAAEEILQKALTFHPNKFSILMELGELAKKRQQLDVALNYFQTAIDIYPQKIKAYLSKIDILMAMESLEEVANCLEFIEQEFPNDVWILIRSGYLNRKLGQRQKALERFIQAQKQASNQSQYRETQIHIIEELNSLGRLDEAYKLADELIQKFPNNVASRLLKGSLLVKQLDIPAAKKVYEDILSIKPNHPLARLELSKIYSQLGQTETAIATLEETYRLVGSNINLLFQLGLFNQAIEEWDTAREWYQKACQEYPNHPQGYCGLSNLMFLVGEGEAAINLLQEAKVNISRSIPISLQIIDIQIRLRNFEPAHQLINQELNLYPNNIQLKWQQARAYNGQGNYVCALKTLDRISTDNQGWNKTTYQLKADAYFCQYNYSQAEKYLRLAIDDAAIATNERNRLALVLMLTGRIDEARQQLAIATRDLYLKSPPGKTIVPLRSHPAMVINELRINPFLLTKIQNLSTTGRDKILELGNILAREPTYLGSALMLAKELREQGIFDIIQQQLSDNITPTPTIPKTIVQFWDHPQPPAEVQAICQSWKKHNQGYEYICFSLHSAIGFIIKHYDAKVLQAFLNCDQPATQSDLFRLAYLNKLGGFYADADDRCCQSLDSIINLNPELVIIQEEFACIGNNFIGCIPGQDIINRAFKDAVKNLSSYSNEAPWFKTGPGLLTLAVCNELLPYLDRDYKLWSRLLVLNQTQLRKIINQHIPLSYKRTEKSWHYDTYQRRIKLEKV